MSAQGFDSKPPAGRIDTEKLRAGLDHMTIAFRRGQPHTFPPDLQQVEWGLVDYGCFGTWPDIAPLEIWMQVLGHLWQCDGDEAFARFDQALDWVLAQPSPPPLWEA